MSRYVNANLARLYLNQTACEQIKSMPTADVQEVRHGKWLVTDAYPHRVYCSECYKTNVPNEEWLFEYNDYPNYCMWCGAKMDKEEL